MSVYNDKGFLVCTDGRGEKVFRGISGFCGVGFAVGRICMPSKSDFALCDGREMLCIFEQIEESRMLGYLCPLTPAGVIVSAGAISGGLINLLTCQRIPYIIVKESFSAELEGKVALLDGESDRVIVDPDIDTLNAYSFHKAKTELLLVERGTDRSVPVLERKDGGGVVIDICGVDDSTELFELLRDIAETRWGESITVRLRVPADEKQRREFVDICEAVFCAAVYGDFALQIEGYSCDSDIDLAVSLLHSAFCRLEEGGREFNGYIRRGILIDAPVWLMRRSPFTKADFICFDFDAITANFIGKEISEIFFEEIPTDAIMRLWEQYFAHFAPSCALRVQCRALLHTSLFEEWVRRAAIDDIYVN